MEMYSNVDIEEANTPRFHLARHSATIVPWPRYESSGGNTAQNPPMNHTQKRKRAKPKSSNTFAKKWFPPLYPRKPPIGPGVYAPFLSNGPGRSMTPYGLRLSNSTYNITYNFLLYAAASYAMQRREKKLVAVREWF